MKKISTVSLFLATVFVSLFLLIFSSRRSSSVNQSPLVQFVRDYKPDSLILKTNDSRQVILNAPITSNEEVIFALDHAEIDLEFRKVVLKAFLKLFYAQMKYYHQSFEVRESPFILTDLN